nr:hypothetical protein [Tanacetum cinerariifolium]
MGQQVHCLVCKYGLCFDLFVANGLVDIYCKCGSLSYARKVFDEMPERDVVSWTNMISGYSNVGRVQESRVLFERMGLEGLGGNEFTWSALITGYARGGDCDAAFSLFRRMSEEGLVPDVATWNTMICGFVQSGETVKGVELFREMLVVGVKPNPVTITGLLPALGSMGKLNSGKEVHGLIYRTNMYNNNVFVASALIDMYSSCGCVKHARNVFDTVLSKNVASWNAMIGCYGKHGLTFFKSMRESKLFEIREEHYGCVIDMLCRSGKIEEAYDLVHELDTEVMDSMVGSFLNGCVSYNRPDLAKKVAAALMKLKTDKPGGFVTLSNVYAGEGEWAKVEMLREVMKVQGVQKLPGFSSLSNDI